MTAQNPLDHQGSLSDHPFAELLVEIEQAKFDGSMRLSHAESKAIVYFREGAVVYAVSNARDHRLAHFITAYQKVDTQRLASLPGCSNDVELAVMLVKQSLLSKTELDAVVTAQIEQILIDLISWQEGSWHFSPLVRSRTDLIYTPDVRRLRTEYGRMLPTAAVLARFTSMKEQFQRLEDAPSVNGLQSHEDYVLNRFAAEPRVIEDLVLECGLPENGFLQALYVLWLGGLLLRRDWNAAFAENRIAAIRDARLLVIKQAQKPIAEVKQETLPADGPAPEPGTEALRPKGPEITLDEFLARAETAATHYDILGVEPQAAVAEVRSSYYLLAKLFHPDRFHRADPAKLQRIQSAFSSVQVAYETLKSSDSRDNYDFKVRKELETREKLRAQGVKGTDKVDARLEQGLESFEVGLSLLMDEEYDRAIPFLGRAAHYSPENALYRAYFGKALSYDENQRHRAENEFQAAVRLDPTNPKIRLMLVEFFIDNNLRKRAEGELKRFLEAAPDNAEAREMLVRLQN